MSTQPDCWNPAACARRLALISALGASFSAAALAEPITIDNPGFEADFAVNNGFVALVPQGWAEYDPFNILDYTLDALGVLNPTGGTNFPAGAPEGNNVALIYIEGDVGAGEVGLRQELSATLQPNSRYTLTVQVGDIASGFNAPPFEDVFFDLEGFPGYAVQLLAGGEVIAEDYNTLDAVLDDGQFALSTIVAEIGAAHDQLNQPLEIRLINLNFPGTEEEPGIEVDFDDVQLVRDDLESPCPGDADGDGDVDFDDLNTVLSNWEAAVTPGTSGDVAPANSGDGVVNFDDLNAVLIAFGAVCL